MRCFFLAVSFGAVGCVGSTEEVPGPDATALPEPEDPLSNGAVDSACGEIVLADVTIGGTVYEPDGRPLPEAQVRLEERSWAPGAVYGAGTTDADGAMWFDAVALPIIADCWAIGPQFFVVVEIDGQVADAAANYTVISAWLDGTLEADFSAFTFDLVPVEDDA